MAGRIQPVVHRLTITNALAGALAFWAHQKGLVAPIFQTDVSYLSYGIVALFAAGLASTFWRAVAEPNHERNAHINDIAQWLQVLGLLGTVIGFSVALESHGMENTAAIVGGLRTAIGTTIIGGFLSLLTAINFRMLDTATAVRGGE